MCNTNQQGHDIEILNMIHTRFISDYINKLLDMDVELADYYKAGILSLDDCKILYSMIVKDVHVLREVFKLPDVFFTCVPSEDDDKGS